MDMPLKEMAQKSSAKFAFYYMLSLVALIFTALAVGQIIFQIINKEIFDAISYRSGFSEEVLKFAISAIIIASPIYFVVMWFVNKNLLSGQLDREAGVRKWLTYFILFVSAVVMIGWLIATLFNFFNGELGIRFILKALTAILISAAIFSFYLYDIRRPEIKAGNRIIRGFYYGSIAIVFAALITSFFFIESPLVTRSRLLDQEITSRMSQIDSAISSYYNQNKAMPENFDILLADKNFYLTADILADPVTKSRFEYKVTSVNTYELCATFRTSNKDQDNSIYYDTRWQHDAGYQCISQKAVLNDIGGKPILR